MGGNVTEVAVNIVAGPDGRVLLAERTARQISAGFWELPGGKLEAGETPAQAAARELQEEVGIVPHRLRRWIRYEHAFPTRRIRLHFFKVEGYSGTPHGREGQRVAWVDPATPTVSPLLPSHHRALAALALPRVILAPRATDFAGPQGLLAYVRKNPAPMVVLDEPGMAPDQRVSLARRVADSDAQVLLAGCAMEAARAGLPGVLTRANELARLHSRPRTKIWVAAVSNEADLARAEALGADAVFLAQLGWESFARLAAGSPIPIFAVGGVSASQLGTALAAGAAGLVVRHLDPPPARH